MYAWIRVSSTILVSLILFHHGMFTPLIYLYLLINSLQARRYDSKLGLPFLYILDAAVIFFGDQVEQPSSLLKVRVSVVYYDDMYNLMSFLRSSISK